MSGKLITLFFCSVIPRFGCEEVCNDDGTRNTKYFLAVQGTGISEQEQNLAFFKLNFFLESKLGIVNGVDG